MKRMRSKGAEEDERQSEEEKKERQLGEWRKDIEKNKR